MRIQAITRDNGWGLSKDIQVLREALSGYVVDFTPYERPSRGKFDWNIHLELINIAHLQSGRVNAFVPNPDWFDMGWLRYLPSFDVILAKTRDTERIFKEFHHNVVYVGWSSPDPGFRVDFSAPGIVHTAGNSSMKGTEAVLQAMKKTPKAKASVTWKKRPHVAIPPNVKFIQGQVPQERFDALRRLPIHLCPSTYEGFGHYINEARAMGAVIITTAEGPMAELVTPEFGMLCPVSSITQHHAAPQYHVDTDALSQLIEIAWASCSEFGQTWGDRARAAYERERVKFHERISALIQK